MQTLENEACVHPYLFFALLCAFRRRFFSVFFMGLNDKPINISTKAVVVQPNQFPA